MWNSVIKWCKSAFGSIVVLVSGHGDDSLDHLFCTARSVYQFHGIDSSFNFLDMSLYRDFGFNVALLDSGKFRNDNLWQACSMHLIVAY